MDVDCVLSAGDVNAIKTALQSQGWWPAFTIGFIAGGFCFVFFDYLHPFVRSVFDKLKKHKPEAVPMDLLA
ncbi:unnamed protein product [Cylicocyclus nassatus]|uniref:Uncharacterized protein n=1 Tax=Cylicocyclus nassatus TaxID=53992 RepID=A0AA36DSL9_CYLNA|nr:unnamed protein product [Cylicocyclus nassatus]